MLLEEVEVAGEEVEEEKATVRQEEKELDIIYMEDSILLGELSKKHLQLKLQFLEALVLGELLELSLES